MTRDIAEVTLDRARELRSLGLSWAKTSRAVGVTEDTLRWRIDPTFAEKWKARHAGPKSMVRAEPLRPTKIEVRRALAAIPTDTRSFTARVMGDPLPGRSALERMKDKDAGPVQTRSFCSRSVLVLVAGAREAEYVEDRPNLEGRSNA